VQRDAAAAPQGRDAPFVSRTTPRSGRTSRAVAYSALSMDSIPDSGMVVNRFGQKNQGYPRL